MKYKVIACIIAVEVTALALLLITSSLSAKKMQPQIAANQQLAKGLMLTDLSLWTETRYTRHPSQADLFTPFQDAPSAIEHFPAGSIVVPPMMPPAVKNTETSMK